MAERKKPDAEDMVIGLQIVVVHLIRTLEEEARKDLFQSLGGWLSRVNKDERVSSNTRTLDGAWDYVHYFLNAYTEYPDEEETKRE